MRIRSVPALAAAALALAAAGPARGAPGCPPDSVPAGSACVDRYEASVWETTDPKLVKRIRKGKIDAVADLGGAIQRGASGDDYEPGCPDNAAGCVDLYAASVPGVLPARFTTWFQAVAFCRNAGKRLATNQEWTMAALGTPDPLETDGTTHCNVDGDGSVATGSRSACVSDAGAFDTVGNVGEWVADWRETSGGFACGQYDEDFGHDRACSGGANEAGQRPFGMKKGGVWASLSIAGAYMTIGGDPTLADEYSGFRCAR
jgi:hypothetical protein